MIFVILIWNDLSGLFAVSCCCYCTFALVFDSEYYMNAVDSFNCAVSERHRRPFKLPVLILLNTEIQIWNNFYFLVNNNNNKTKSF